MNNQPETMTKEQAIELICAKISEVYNNDFPCICGKNHLGSTLNPRDIGKLYEVLGAIDLLKE